ncbi:unnamed protein product, partial [Polarella glacialis]
VTLNFRVQGIGGLSSPTEGSGGPAACLSIRLDLEITTQAAADSARLCPQGTLGKPSVSLPQPLPSPAGDSWSVGPGSYSYSTQVVNGIVWQTKLPAVPGSSANLVRLSARISFPSQVHPLRILVEELDFATVVRADPSCTKRCFTGTPVANGQVLQRLLPPGVPFVVWILSEDESQDGIDCVFNFDFELTVGSAKAEPGLPVSDWSVFRLTTQFATTPARPCAEFKTVRIPSAGAEFRHSIHLELQPGEYTLVFLLDLAFGGLRPCSSVLVHLALDPWEGRPTGSTTIGRCTSDATSSMLDMQAMAEPVQLGALSDRSEASKGIEVIARTVLQGMHYEADMPPMMLRARVTSPFAEADIQVQFYEDGTALGEPRPLADGSGYLLLAGPVFGGRFYVVYMTPPSLSGKDAAPLPGATSCWLAGSRLPTQVTAREGWPLVLEGEFLLPPDGQHSIAISAPTSGEQIILRAIVSSSDAEVRIGQGAPALAGLAEDYYFNSGGAGTDIKSLAIRAARTLSSSSCPMLKLHLVLMRAADAPSCPTGGLMSYVGMGGSGHPLQEFGRRSYINNNNNNNTYNNNCNNTNKQTITNKQ